MTGKNYFKCGFCGTEYSNIKDRMKCERECYDEQSRQEKLREKEKLANERQIRIDEIKTIEKTFHEKLASFYKDYGTVYPVQRFSDAQLLRNIFDILRL